MTKHRAGGRTARWILLSMALTMTLGLAPAARLAAAPATQGYEGEVRYTISAPTASVQGVLSVRFDAPAGATPTATWAYANSAGHFASQAGRLCKTGEVVSAQAQGELPPGQSSLAGEDARRQYLIRIGLPHAILHITCTTSPGVSGLAPGDALQSACGDPIPAGAALPAAAPTYSSRALLAGSKVCTYPFGSAGGRRVNFISWRLHERTADTVTQASAAGYAAPVAEAALSSLKPSAGALKPDFDPATTVYYLAVSHDVESVTLSATTAHAGEQVTFYQPASVTGGGSATQPLPVGPSAIPVVVTTADKQNARMYVLQVTRAP